jgi:Pre-toxin TG
MRSSGRVSEQPGHGSAPRTIPVRQSSVPSPLGQTPAEHTADDSWQRDGISAANLLALQRSAGNQAAAALVEQARRNPTVQRQSVYDITTVAMRNVPAQLQGRALKVHVVARWGELSQDQAADLVDRTGVPSAGVTRDEDGTVTFSLTQPEEAMISRLRAKERSSPDTIGPSAEAVPDDRPRPAPSADPERTVAEQVAIAAADIGTDFTPLVSNVKDALTALTGINAVTGERVGVAGRIAAAIFAIPVIGNLAKYLGKGIRLLWKGLKLLGDKIGVHKLTRWLKQQFRKLTGNRWAGSLGAGKYTPKTVQTGGRTINKRTAQALNEFSDMDLTPREWGRALESLKGEHSLSPSHHGKILANGDYADESGNVIDNLLHYIN